MRKIKISDFDYHLPSELIAQKPFFPRDKCRLMVLDKKRGQIQHRCFFEIEKFLRAGDVLVLNNSKVFKARLFGEIKNKKLKIKKYVEIFLLRPLTPPLSPCGRGKERGNVWQVLANPGRKLKIGARVVFIKNVWCEVMDKVDDKYLVRFNLSNQDLMKWVDKYGHVPVPPYIKKEPKRAEEYQTVYAQKTGSVAAPTAGFHFTRRLLRRLNKLGVKTAFITLHVGYGTFKPIKSKYIAEHKMEPEWVEISKNVAEEINRAKKEGRRVIAVGTTTVRALEGFPLTSILSPKGRGKGGGQEVNLFITSGFKFKIIDALITNFHLPKSTLLLLVSALGGQENIHKAYQEAIKKKYRFYSFGDAMLIV